MAERGPATLASGATAARLCDGYYYGDTPASAPHDVLTTGISRLIDSINTQPRHVEYCDGPFGVDYDLVLQYPDGSRRVANLNFSACGSILVGGNSRANPQRPYITFMHLVRQQRATTSPPADVPAPACMTQYARFAPVARPVDMVSALMCVTYADNGRTTSTPVPTRDLQTILLAWQTGPRTPSTKTDPCPQTTPTWVLSGVTQWGDPVQITAECSRVSNGESWVQLSPEAQAAVDRLVARAGVQVNDGSHATTAWMLAQAWLDDVNARATISYHRTAAHIARVANSLWVRDPWLPEGGLDWYLQGATRTTAPGWEEAWRIPARTPDGEAVFVVVRHSRDEPWRILSLTR